VSERLAADAANEPSLEIKEQPQRWDFDKDGNLLRF
jgi:hypothetical protein